MRKNFKNKTSRLRSRQRGFTLIELLVVIAVIALLATVAVVALSSARTKSRDAKRIADMKQIQNALALYADSNKDLYPSIASNEVGGLQTLGFWGDSSCAGDSKSDLFIEKTANTVEWLVDAKLMASMPDDPKNTTTNDCYLYVHSNSELTGAKKAYLLTTLENKDAKKCPGLAAVLDLDSKYCSELN